MRGTLASVKGRRPGRPGRPGPAGRRPYPPSTPSACRSTNADSRWAPLRDGRRRHQRRAVEGAGELVQLHRDTRLQQALGVRDPLVTQRVVLGRRDVGRRQPREILGPGRRGVGRHVGRAVERTEIRLPALHRQRPVPHGRVHEGLHGGGLQPIVELGDLQELEAHGWAAPVAGQQGRRRREPTPGARPGQRHPIGVDAQASASACRYAQRGVTVVQAGRDRGARAPGGSRPTPPRRRWPMAICAAPACSASTLPITKPPPWIITMPGTRVAAAARPFGR